MAAVRHAGNVGIQGLIQQVDYYLLLELCGDDLAVYPCYVLAVS